MSDALLTIEIWSDLIYPWCYIGKRNLEAALAEFPHRDAVALRWRAFQLDPDAPADGSIDLHTALQTKFHTDRAGVDQMLERVSGVAADAGLAYRFDIARRSGTFDAHRLMEHARVEGCADALAETLFDAYFCRGANLGDRDTLADLAATVGLDRAGVRSLLDTGTYGAEVRGDIRTASELDISGVPFFLANGRVGVAGAQAPQRLRMMLDRAWERTTAD